MTYIAYAEVVEGPLYEERHWETGEISHRYNCQVGVTVGGVNYVHPHSFRWKSDAEVFAAKVTARHVVDLSLWAEVDEPESFEERYQPFGSAWMEEEQDRLGR